MKKITLSTLIATVLIVNAQAASTSSAVYIPLDSNSTSAISIIKSNASSTATSTWDAEVDNNYSEILGLTDCKLIGKRVVQRVDRINERLDKQSKAVSELIDKINEIKDDESLSSDASTTETLIMETDSLNIKMQDLATDTMAYVKSLKSIDVVKCTPNVKYIKSQISATKPQYRDVLIADNELRLYITNEVKPTLLMLKNETVETEKVEVESKAKVEEKGFWSTVKGLFK